MKKFEFLLSQINKNHEIFESQSKAFDKVHKEMDKYDSLWKFKEWQRLFNQAQYHWENLDKVHRENEILIEQIRKIINEKI